MSNGLETKGLEGKKIDKLHERVGRNKGGWGKTRKKMKLRPLQIGGNSSLKDSVEGLSEKGNWQTQLSLRTGTLRIPAIRVPWTTQYPKKGILSQSKGK